MNMTTPVARPDTRDMLGIHRVFRDAFGCAPQLVGSVCGERRDRVETVADYYANVLAMLRAHHEGEDEIVWPRLAERAPEQLALVRHMQDQHESLTAALAEAEQRLADWRTDADIERGASLAASLATLGVLCASHFDEEERKILPLAAEHITVEEWAELPAHAMRTFAGEHLWLVIGLVQEQMPANVRDQMEASMPPPLRDMWQADGRDQFADFVARLRG